MRGRRRFRRPRRHSQVTKSENESRAPGIAVERLGRPSFLGHKFAFNRPFFFRAEIVYNCPH